MFWITEKDSGARVAGPYASRAAAREDNLPWPAAWWIEKEN